VKLSSERSDSTILTLGGLRSLPGATFSTSLLESKQVLFLKSLTSGDNGSLDSAPQTSSVSVSSVVEDAVVVFAVDGFVVVDDITGILLVEGNFVDEVVGGRVGVDDVPS